jgi:pre-rRNA-processing protein TSR1
VADLLLVLLPVHTLPSDVDAVSLAAMTVLPCLKAQGLPPCIGALVNVNAMATDGDTPHLAPASVARARSAAKAAGEDILGAALGVPQPRCLPADPGTECSEFVRQLGGMKLAPPVWRQLRPYLLAEQVQYVQAAGGESACLVVTGHLRGAALSADQLLHLPLHGEFRITRITAAAPATASAAAAHGMEVDGSAAGEVVVLSLPVEATRESLQREHVPDPLAGEQTWPTDEDMADAAAASVKARVEAAQEPVRRLARRPKGWSDYQAAWIKDDDEEEEDAEEEEEEVVVQNGGGSAPAAGPADGVMPMDDGDAAPADTAASDGDSDDDDSLLGEDEMTQDEALAAARHDSERRLALRRAAEAAEAAGQAEFPDEVDVPLEQRASVRFARYRGLKSFRSSAWDPYESLPPDYARIFAFQNLARTRRRALAGPPAGQGAARVDMGTRVCVHLEGVSPDAAAALLASWHTRPLVALGLLQHEAKLSVLHAAVGRATGYGGPPVKSKVALTWHCGFRVFTAPCCIFSQDGNGDKFKYERFLPPSGAGVVVSGFGPITYGPAPVLLFAHDAEQQQQQRVLVATGSLRPVDPERVVVKRAILTGFPHKVHKRKAVVRFMFHCPEDVRWFKPLEVWTKYGRHGRIREALGTHGSMKCAFDGVLQQRDTVCVSLYKRVFPKLQATGGHGQ